MANARESGFRVTMGIETFVVYVWGNNSQWTRRQLIIAGGERKRSMAAGGLTFKDTAASRKAATSILERCMGLDLSQAIRQAEFEMPRRKQATVYFDEGTLQDLKTLAKRLRVSEAELVRHGVQMALKKFKDSPGPGLTYPFPAAQG